MVGRSDAVFFYPPPLVVLLGQQSMHVRLQLLPPQQRKTESLFMYNGGLDFMVSPVARNGECSLSTGWTRSTPMSSRGGKLLEREDLAGDLPGPCTDLLLRLRGLSGCQSLPSGRGMIVGREPPVASGLLPIPGDRSHSSSFKSANIQPFAVRTSAVITAASFVPLDHVHRSLTASRSDVFTHSTRPLE